MKGKAKQTQLHQDNTVKGVKKLDKGQTMVCYVEWGRSKEEREEASKQVLQHLHQQGGQEGLHTILVKEEEK